MQYVFTGQYKVKEYRMQYRQAINKYEIEECVNLIGDVFIKEENYGMVRIDEDHAYATYYGLWHSSELISAFRIIPFEHSHIFHAHPELKIDYQNSRNIELSRVVISKDYRGNKFFKQLFMFVADLCISLDIDYFFGSILYKLLPLYKSVGANILGNPYYDCTVDDGSGLPNSCIAIWQPINVQKLLLSR